MTFKEKITKAIDEHFEKHKEVITTVYIGAILWPKQYEQRRYTQMHDALNKGLILKDHQIRKLKSIFPETDGDFWIQ